MKNDIIKNIINKYELALPILPSEQRMILRSKRRTLVAILGKDLKRSMLLVAAVRLYYMLSGVGIPVTIANACRAAVFASVVTVIAVAAGSTVIIQNYIYRQGVIAVNEVQRHAVITASEGLRIKRGGKEIKYPEAPGIIKAGDYIITGKFPAYFQTDGRAVVKLMRHSEVFVSEIGYSCMFDLKNGGILSKTPVLNEGMSFVIHTPDCIVSVVGTEFGVTYIDEKTKVFVVRGKVNIKQKDSGFEYILSEGESTVVNGERKISTISDEETRIMKGIGGIEYVESIGLKKSIELKNIKEKFFNTGVRGSREGMTLDQIKEKFGRVDEVVLYNGRIIKGAITSRDGNYTIVTERGTVTVPENRIKSSRIIR